MKVFLKPKQFRFGKSSKGIVVGFSKNIWEISKAGLSFAESDVQSRWDAGVSQNGKLVTVYLTFWWKEPVNVQLTIPFNMLDSFQKNLAKTIAKNRKLTFVNTEDLTSPATREADFGLWADVVDNSILEWLEWDALGMDIRNWKSSTPKPRFKMEEDNENLI